MRKTSRVPLYFKPEHSICSRDCAVHQRCDVSFASFLIFCCLRRCCCCVSLPQYIWDWFLANIGQVIETGVSMGNMLIVKRLVFQIDSSKMYRMNVPMQFLTCKLQSHFSTHCTAINRFSICICRDCKSSWSIGSMELWSHKSYFVSIKLNGSPVFNGHSISTCKDNENKRKTHSVSGIEKEQGIRLIIRCQLIWAKCHLIPSGIRSIFSALITTSCRCVNRNHLRNINWFTKRERKKNSTLTCMVVDTKGTQHLLLFWQWPQIFGRYNFRETHGPSRILDGPIRCIFRHSCPFC